ncbi:response regulator [Desulfobacterales bacterium HSG16]|nr:response regulator [Desulfobacterales bacterium HSG16]
MMKNKKMFQSSTEKTGIRFDIVFSIILFLLLTMSMIYTIASYNDGIMIVVISVLCSSFFVLITAWLPGNLPGKMNYKDFRKKREKFFPMTQNKNQATGKEKSGYQSAERDDNIPVSQTRSDILIPCQKKKQTNTDKFQILIVDDKSINMQVLDACFSTEEYSVIQADNGAKALEIIQSIFKPDLVLIDAVMPGISGFDVCRKIREMYSAAELPVILSTAKNRAEDLVEVFNAGANDYITRPFLKDELLSRIRCHLLLSIEIKEGRKIQAELNASKEVAEAAAIAKNEFLANISHEIRTPINAIVGLTMLALKSNPDIVLSDYLKKIEQSSKCLLEIVTDILDFSKIEAGRMEIRHSVFDIQKIVDRISDIFYGKIVQKQLKWTVEIDDKIPANLIGDAGRIEQILTHLTGNAFKFTDQGEITIRVFKLRNKNDKIWLLFSIKDTGIGIETNLIPHLFSSFTQADSSTTRKYGGTGLGLVICRRLARIIGGKIWCESIPGKGSTFFLKTGFGLGHDFNSKVQGAMDNGQNKECVIQDYESSLQEVDETDEKETDENETDEKEIESRICEEKIRGSKILLVEDNIINQQVAKEILEMADISVDIASNGKESLDMLGTASYDAVLMDLQMPEMDGFAAARKIRQISDLKQLPVIAMSANSMKEDKEKCIKSGMNDYIAKPVTTDRLFSVLAKYIRHCDTEEKNDDENKKANIKNLDRSCELYEDESENADQDLCHTLENYPGIDVHECLARLSGNKNLLKKLFKEFLKNYADTLDEYLSDSGSGFMPKDIKAFSMYIHDIKGVSGNLAAQDLFQACSKLEYGLKNGQELSLLITKFRQEFELVMESVKKIIGPELRMELEPELKSGKEKIETLHMDRNEKNNEKPDFDYSEMKAVLSELSRLLKSNNPKAELFLESNRENLDYPVIRKELKNLHDHVDIFNFKGASRVLDEITEILDSYTE